MIESIARHGGEIGSCGTCLDARGVPESMLTKGARRASLDELADWTTSADKVITFKRTDAITPGSLRLRRTARPLRSSWHR
jgi:hypothetical protein